MFVRILRGYRLAVEGKFDDRAWSDRGLEIMGVAEDCGVDVQMSGFDVIRDLKAPVVFVANHMSTFETMVLPSAILIFQRVTTVVKDSLLHYPFFGRIMRTLDPINVHRVNPREDLQRVLTRGEECLRAGRSVVLFPQATRNPVFSPEGFNSLGVKLAARAGASIVPVALRTDFQSVGRIIRDFGRVDPAKPVRIRIGAPLAVEGNGKQAHKQAVEFIAANLKEWGARTAS